MYIKLTLNFQKWIVPACAGGVNAFLACKPEVVDDLPEDIKANTYSKTLKTLLTKELVNAEYYLDCKELSQDAVSHVLNIFAHHYQDYTKGLPAAMLTGGMPNQNELIVNLQIAFENVRSGQSKPLLSVNSMNSLEEMFQLQLT